MLECRMWSIEPESRKVSVLRLGCRMGCREVEVMSNV